MSEEIVIHLPDGEELPEGVEAEHSLTVHNIKGFEMMSKLLKWLKKDKEFKSEVKE